MQISHIVHFGKYYFPERGGIESVTISLAEGAVLAEYSVSVVCFRTGNSSESERINTVEVLRAPIAGLISSQPLGFRYFFLCLREARRADLIHMHGPNMLAALCCLLVPRRTRLLVHWHSDIVGKGWLGRVLRPLEQALLRRADRVVATSPAYAVSSVSLAKHTEKIRIVPIGTRAPRELNPELSPMWADRLVNKRLVLSVGRLVPYKGFDVLIAAAARLPENTAVVIVGGGPLENELRARIETAGLNDRVYLAGKLDDATLDALFRHACVYCMPSRERSEAFGVVLLEAMAHGIPIVATEIPGSGVPWVNQHECSGLNVPVNDPVALANACSRILLSEAERERFAKASRQRFLDFFTEEESVRKMTEIYSELLTMPKEKAKRTAD